VARAEDNSAFGEGCPSRFQNTLWSRIFAAGRLDGPEASEAWEELCRIYWYPIYAFLRRSGHSQHDACDLAQGFFAYLFEKNLVQKADPDKGRFRSFLLGTLKHYAHNEDGRKHTIKRGGQADIVSIDEETAEGLYLHEPATDLTPDKLFDRRWAMTVLEETKRRLEAEYRRAGMQKMFAEIYPHLTGDHNGTYGELATRLNKTEGATRKCIHDTRKHWREVINAVIADTVANPDLVEIERKHLLDVLRGC
jgi:DNA-directed RNA polymerase specialized sigma24 family protein